MTSDMWSSKVSGNPSSSAVSSNPSFKGSSTSDFCKHSIDQLSNGVSDMTVDSAQNGGWEEYGKKSNNRSRANASAQWAPHNSTFKAWTHSDALQKLGLRCNVKPWSSSDDESDGTEDSDFDSDESEKSHENKKKNRWFNDFFQCLDGLTLEEINGPKRRWHCPACKGGPGAIDWYRGLQPLMAHATTISSKRVKLHRKLAEVLDEELRRRGWRGSSAVPAGEVFGRWKGLGERADKEIVWPPMVVIMNTRLERDGNDRWIGMGNQELLDYFSGYSAVRARHSYGPQGHRGMSVLIFEASAVGYAEAERLSKHFEDNFRDRIAWERNSMPFSSGGKRKLYGYMAEKQDLENFNQHSQSKSKLKYEMRSYQEMVVKQMKQMREENEQQRRIKNKVSKEEMRKKALEELHVLMREKLWMTLVDNRVSKLMAVKHHEHNEEAMDSQEQFYREYTQQLYGARNAKDDKNFEKTHQIAHEKVSQSMENLSVEEGLSRVEEMAKFLEFKEKKGEGFEKEMDEVMKDHAERILDMERQYWDQKMALEKEYMDKLIKLVDNYTSSFTKS